MRARSALLAVLVVLIAVAAGIAGVVALRAGEALPGTTVSGVDVGGLDRAGVQQRVGGLAQDRTTGVLEVVHEEVRVALDRAELGVEADLEETADRALSAGRSGSLLAPVLGPLLGRGEAVELALQLDEQVLRQRVDAVAEQVDRPVFAGDIVVEGVEVSARPPVPGREVDRAQAVADVEQALADGRTEALALPVEQDEPGTTAADVEQVAAQAREALAGPYRLTGPQAVLEVTPDELAPLLSAQDRDGALVLAVQDQQLRELVGPRADALDRPALPARVEVAGSPPVVDTQGDLTWTPRPASVSVSPATPGLDVDAEAAVQRVLELVGGPVREAELPATVTASPVPTEQASGVRSLLGTFTTYFPPGQPRAANIRLIATVLDGTYVAPGGRLSLNDVAGPRTAAKGYQADGAIIDGELVDVVGGGVSQFATTLFNAAFFAGLPIEEHRPHSFYISRYPAGRESTVNYGSIDVKVRNDTAAGLLVTTSSTSSSVTVALYGDNGGRTVTSTSGPREPRADGGFRISVTRTVTGGDGRGGTRTFRTSYNPAPD